MERSAWTDERLGDRFDHIDRELSQLHSEIRDLRSETGDRYTNLRSEMSDLRSEMHDGFADLRSEMRNGSNDLRSLTIRLHLGTLIPILGLIAAMIARGA